MGDAPGVVLAAIGLRAEATVVRSLTARGSGFRVLRRVSDVVELVGVASTLQVDVVVVSPRFPRLSREVVERLSRHGLVCLAVVDPQDEASERLAMQWGLPTVVIDTEQSAAASLAGALQRCAGPQPGTELPPGRVIAVCGTAGAPGTSTVAVNLAAELSAVGKTCLIDLDPVNPSAAFLLGVPDEPSGLSGALALAARGLLTPPALAGCVSRIRDGPDLLGGARGRVPGLTAGFGDVLGVARSTYGRVVADCAGAAAEMPGEPLVGDVLAAAGQIVVVATPTALGIRRFVAEWPAIRDAAGAADLLVLWNGVPRNGPLGREPLRRLGGVVTLAGGGAAVAVLPSDRPAACAMDRRPGPLRTVAPRSPLRRAIADLAAQLAPAVPSPGRNRTPRHTGARGSA